MPVAPVDSKGTELYYDDNGAPPATTSYRTVILLHGGYFNGKIFKPAFPYAVAHGLGVIAVNKRDYFGSTDYSDKELAALNSSDEPTRIGFLKQRLVELAAFIVWIIENEGIPEPAEDDFPQGGGISLVAWSSGNCLTIPFFALASELLDSASLTLIQKYLRSYVMYDSPNFPHGLPLPIIDGNHYSPFSDPALTPADIIQQFPTWVSGFYTHSPSALTELTTPLDSPSQFNSEEEYVRQLALKPDPEPAPTMNQIAARECGLESCEPPLQVARAHVQLLFISPSLYAECVGKLFLDESRPWPRLRKEIVVCGRSVALTLYTAWDLKQKLNKALAEGNSTVQNNTRFHLWEEFNHMSHWDEPEEFARRLAKII